MKPKKVSLYICTTITVIIILGLWTTGSMSLLNPVEWRWLALSGYAFPAFLIATLAMLVAWALLKQWRLVFITMTGLVVAYMPVMLYCPIHSETEVPDDAIQVMTYNTENWGHGYKNEPGKQEDHIALLQYIADRRPDIVCIQEGNLNSNNMKMIDSLIKPRLQYVDSVICMNKAPEHMIIFSRFPIIRKQAVSCDTASYGSAAFWLSIHGKEVIVVNNHLQSMGLSLEDREHFSKMVHGKQESDSMKVTSHTIFGKILEASCKRAPQAEAVARFIRLHSGVPIIVCGDFNDLPLSYVHRAIAQRLTDCYEATAFGPGFTFSHYGMRVRIDNILCSDAFQPYNCFVDESTDLSDHYPMRCWLKME